MRIPKSKNAICISVFFFLGFSALAQEALDGVLAVVGDEIILKSELEQTAQFYALQLGLNPYTQKEKMEQLKKEILENLINERVLLAKAKEDTIQVDDRKVEAELENRIQALIQQVGSKERLEAQWGAPISKIKRDNREQVGKMLLVREVLNQKFKNVQVSRKEVERFYESIRDSLPEKKPSVRLSQILITIRPGAASRESALEKIRAIQQRIKAGEDFAELARQYSEDPGTAKRGGELGFVERGSFFQSFEEAAFRLEPNEVSEIVETPVGFHLIQMIERRGDKINVRHILIRVEKGPQDEIDAKAKIDEIYQRAISGEDFRKLVKECSEDSVTKEKGGDLGWFTPDEIQIPEFRQVIDTLEVGEVSAPFRTQFGFHIVKLEEKREARKYNLTEDYEDFKARALELKLQKLREEWIEELKKNIYIEIKKDLL